VPAITPAAPRATARAVRLVPLAAVAAGALALAPAAFGADAVLEPGGGTVLTLDRATAGVLADNGVSVAPIRPARPGAARGTVAFPITGGQVEDLSTGAGVVRHSGGLALRAGGTTVRLTDFQVSVGRRSQLTARVGAARVPILDLNTARATVGIAQGRLITVAGVRTTLTTQAAAALNRAFHVSLFRKGIPLGTVRVQARAYSTSVTLDSGLATALSGAGISAAPVAPGGADGAGRLVFPVSGGGLAARTFAGQVPHGGGITLSRGATRVALTDFTIDTTTTATPQLTALVGGQRVPVLSISLAAARTSTRGGVAEVRNARLSLTPAAAGLLNQTFGLGTTLSGATVFGAAQVRAPIR